MTFPRISSFAKLFSYEKPLVLKRYFLLDGARGLAALAVILYHYKAFIDPLHPPGGDVGGTGREPLRWLLSIVYDQGSFAVPIFWMISGFVFAAVYAGQSVSTRNFFVNRLARLYPLHLLTLLVMAGLQLLAWNNYGRWFIYTNNDAFHFMLQLFFASNWGIAGGFSFNGPIWSVSVEVLIYFVFWLLHRNLLLRGVTFPLLIACLFLPLSLIGPILQIGRCGFFFVGCAIISLHCAVKGQRPLVLSILCAMAVAGVAGFLTGQNGIVRYVGMTGIFGGMILGLAELEDHCSGRLRHICTVVGDNTYGMYLWHIPVQMVLILSLLHLGTLPALAENSWFMLLYVVVVVLLARASFLWFERPMRNWMRKMDGRSATKIDRAPISAP